MLVLACAAIAAFRLVQVHSQGWEWRLSPSAAPPRISFDHRSYLRSTRPRAIPAGEVRRGSTPGGGTIFADKDTQVTDTIVWVVTAQQTFAYALQGGP